MRRMRRDFIRDPSLKLYLPLYRLDGQSFVSKDAYGYLATVTGATWEKQGRSFDGIDDVINGGAVAFGWNNDFTLLLWASLLSGVGAQGGLFTNREVSWITLGWESTSVAIEISGTDYMYSGVDVRDKGYYLFSVTSVAHIIRMQINGVAVGTPAFIDATALNLGSSGQTVRIGTWATGAGGRWKGGIGEVLFYNRALTSLEITSLYLATRWRYQ